MVDVEFIKLRARDGWSIREIARRTGWSRQTVRKALTAPASPPRYTLRVPRPAPVMGPYLDLVRSWLAEDESAPPKQRHTAKRIYDRLVAEHGFAGSEVTVRRTVAALRPRRTVPYVPLEAPPGEIAQADFGGAVVTIAGVRTEVALFCLRAKASQVPFVIAYPSERLEAFLAGHVAACAFFGGVFAELWYDNAKTAVTKILAGPAREEHQLLSALRAHYLFASSFCTPGAGNEKGSVENLVGYVRRNALVPYSRSFASLEELNEHLRAWCERERERHHDAWQLERAALGALPAHPFRACVSRPVVANKLALVSIERVRYSVPVACAGATLRAESFVDRIELYRGEQRLACHARSYARGETVLDLAHYLDAFARKPRAALRCAALASADPVFLAARDLARRAPDGHRRFAEILLLGRELGLERLATALRTALTDGGALDAARVRQLALNAEHRTPEPIVVPAALAVCLPAADLARYDALAGCVR
ncbi:MAG: IS21 family transposase [Acidobacteriota bacterium]